jgi:hypothetical protein
MRGIEWRDLIVSAVERKDESMLNSLAAHLAGCEEANRLLRANGCGTTGTAIVDAVRVALRCGKEGK